MHLGTARLKALDRRKRRMPKEIMSTYGDDGISRPNRIQKWCAASEGRAVVSHLQYVESLRDLFFRDLVKLIDLAYLRGLFPRVRVLFYRLRGLFAQRSRRSLSGPLA